MKTWQLGYCFSVVLIAGVQLSMPSSAHAQMDDDTYNGLIDGWQAAIDAGNYRQAERYALQIKANDQRFHPGKFFWMTALGMSYYGQGRYEESLPLFEAEYPLTKRKYGASDSTLESIMNLGAVYVSLGKFDKARVLLEEGVEMGRRVLGKDHPTTLGIMTNLGLVYHETGDLQRAATIYREAVDGYHRQNSKAPNRLIPICNLVEISVRQGRYEYAESMARYGISTARSIGVSMEHHSVLRMLQNLANVYTSQQRPREARPILESVVVTAQRVMGENHPDVAQMIAALADCYADLNEREKSVQMRIKAIEILTQSLGKNHPKVLVQSNHIAWALIFEGNFADAENFVRPLLAEFEKAAGPRHQNATTMRQALSEALLRQNKFEEARAVLQPALEAIQTNTVGEAWKHAVWRNVARVEWASGNKTLALEEMNKALEIVESGRAFSSGADVERAAAFSEFLYTYEILLGWQLELGQADAAFATVERSRARTYLESFNAVGVDLYEGRSATEKARLQQQRADLQANVSQLEAKLFALPAPANGESEKVTEQRQKLVAELDEARTALYRFERDLRSASPAYRRLIVTQSEGVKLAQVRETLLSTKGLLLSYFLGTEKSFLLIVSPKDTRMVELILTEELAKALGLAAGPLLRDDVQKALQGDPNSSILPQLTRANANSQLNGQLHAVWQALLPADVRDLITSGDLDQLVIIPDGPLALLPMETLVTSTSPLTYLLDVAPPITYGPSAAILLKLATRERMEPGKTPVLTLGNPLYERTGSPIAQDSQLASRSATLRSILKPLPASGTEAQWVAETFRKAGMESTLLLGPQATEAGIRTNLQNKQIVHLACHGMSDDAYGNFFGALAVAPGQRAGNPKDDGMLNLAEIYELNLSGCELAILSACMTNHGPEQEGEGVWALSRGFLVAGSRRVVASNWVVDDAAGASVVSVFCSRLARARSNQKPADYAAALRDAKLWVRGQDKWASPFYWAPLVLVGPK